MSLIPQIDQLRRPGRATEIVKSSNILSNSTNGRRRFSDTMLNSLVKSIGCNGSPSTDLMAWGLHGMDANHVILEDFSVLNTDICFSDPTFGGSGRHSRTFVYLHKRSPDLSGHTGKSHSHQRTTPGHQCSQNPQRPFNLQFYQSNAHRSCDSDQSGTWNRDANSVKWGL